MYVRGTGVVHFMYLFLSSLISENVGHHGYLCIFCMVQRRENVGDYVYFISIISYKKMRENVGDHVYFVQAKSPIFLFREKRQRPYVHFWNNFFSVIPGDNVGDHDHVIFFLYKENRGKVADYVYFMELFNFEHTHFF